MCSRTHVAHLHAYLEEVLAVRGEEAAWHCRRADGRDDLRSGRVEQRAGAGVAQLQRAAAAALALGDRVPREVQRPPEGAHRRGVRHALIGQRVRVDRVDRRHQHRAALLFDARQDWLQPAGMNIRYDQTRGQTVFYLNVSFLDNV